MPIDIRATVTCSLGGELISASISDSYVQGSGLIQTKGKCEIKGLIRPAIGTLCTFSYTKAGITRTIPRALRVLSCFPDPFRGITSIVLGCKLTYKQNEYEKVIWVGEGEEEPIGGDQPYTNPYDLIPTVSASTVARRCLSKIGISGSVPPLSAKFIVERGDTYDFSSGFVNILSGLLSSESYCGYLDEYEHFRYFSLDASGGSGPTLDSESLIDIGPISGGQQPGGSVVVRTRRRSIPPAQPPDWPTREPIVINFPEPSFPELPDPVFAPIARNPSWTSSQSSHVSEVLIAYSDPNTGESETEIIRVSQNTYERTEYTEINNRNVVSYRYMSETSSGAAVVGNAISQYLSAGLRAGAIGDVNITLNENFNYDEEGNEVYHSIVRTGNGLLAAGSTGLPFVVDNVPVSIPSGTFLLEQVDVYTFQQDGFRRSITYKYGPWIQTVYGQQAVAESADSFTNATEVSNFLAKALAGTYLLDYTVDTGYTSETAQEGPSGFVLRLPNPDLLNPNDNEDVELEVDTGGEGTTIRIEFDLPFSGDDYLEQQEREREEEEFKREYYAIEYNNAQIAVKYGRVQNRLILGNRDGMFFQVPAEKMPRAPFSPVFISAGGLTALYRTNGTTWTMDGNSGIVASCDALFWGGAGDASGTGTFWFPVAPGVTRLPTTPPVVDTTPTEIIGTELNLGAAPEETLVANYPSPAGGATVFEESTNDFWQYNGTSWQNIGPIPGPTLTVETVVKPWNETLNVVGRVRTTVRFASVNYALQLFTELPPLTTRTSVVVSSSIPVVTIALSSGSASVLTGGSVLVPSTSIALAAPAPGVSSGSRLTAPAASITVNANPPFVTAGGSVTPSAVGVAFNAIKPFRVGSPNASTVVSPPAVSLGLAPTAPVIAPGVVVTSPTGALVFSASSPTVSCGNSLVAPSAGFSISASAPVVTGGADYWATYSGQVFGYEGTFLPDGWAT